MTTTKKIKSGDEVNWKWGTGVAHGKVKKVKAGKDEIKSKGTKVTRNGSQNDPSVEIESDKGSKVLKKASELKKG